MGELFENLPSEIHQRMCEYLIAYDVVSFTSTCKKIQSNLDIATFTDTFSYQGIVHKNEHWIGEFRDAVKFDCTFKDQGWGNRKSFLNIHEYDMDEKPKMNEEHRCREPVGSCVASSGIAEHSDRPVCLEFQPKTGKKYTMSYHCGGGGGHQLFVKNPEIKVLFYHNNGLYQAAKVLEQSEVRKVLENDFGLSMFKGVIDSFIEKNDSTMIGDEGDKSNGSVMAGRNTSSLEQSMEAVGIDAKDGTMLEGMKRFLVALEDFRLMNPRKTDHHEHGRNHDDSDDEDEEWSGDESSGIM